MMLCQTRTFYMILKIHGQVATDSPLIRPIRYLAIATVEPLVLITLDSLDHVIRRRSSTMLYLMLPIDASFVWVHAFLFLVPTSCEHGGYQHYPRSVLPMRQMLNPPQILIQTSEVQRVLAASRPKVWVPGLSKESSFDDLAQSFWAQGSHWA